MTMDFTQRVSFIEKAKTSGIDAATQALEVSEETAHAWWDWYRRQVCKPMVWYQRGAEGQILEPTPGDGRELGDFSLIAKQASTVRFQGKVYSVQREGLYRFMVIPDKMRNLISLRNDHSLIPLLMALSNLQIHGNRHDSESIETLKARLYTDPWISVTCGTISALAVNILHEQGFRARWVHTLTLEDWNTYDNGHSLLEVFAPQMGKWILADVDMGLLFREGDSFLNAYEFWQTVDRGEQPEFFVLSPKEIDPFYLSPSGFNYALWARWDLKDRKGKWRWYQRIFQVLGIGREGKDGETKKWVFFGPRVKIREYYGDPDHSVILEKKEWLEEFYGGCNSEL